MIKKIILYLIETQNSGELEYYWFFLLLIFFVILKEI